MTLTASRPEMVHLSRMDVFQQECGVGRNAAATAATNWTDLIRGLEATRDQDSADVEGSWLDTQAFPCVPFSSHPLPPPPPPPSNPAAMPPAAVAAAENNQVGSGSGDFCLQVGSPAYSSTSSERNSSGLVDGASEVDNTSLSSYLMDGNIRAMLKKITVNEGVLNKAIESLGGGEKGLKGLMSYIMTWMKDQSGNNNNNNNIINNSTEFSISQPPSQQHQPMKPLLGFPQGSSPFGAPSSGGMAPFEGAPSLEQERFHPLSSHMVQTSSEAPHPQGGQDLRHLHRIKSRRLMVVDVEVESVGEQENGFCPTGFRDIGAMPSDFNHSPYPKLEMGPASPGAVLGPLMPRMQQYDDELQQQHARFNCLQQQPSMGYTVGTNEGKISTAPSLAATTRAARKNRIARQRQSVLNQNRAAAGGGQAVAMAVAGAGGAIAGCGSGHWSLGALRKTGIYTPGLQQGPSCDHPATNNARKVCNMDLLTVLLQKELRPSDVGNLGRIILPKKEAEMHLPFLAVREGISLQMEDFDTGVCWSIRYRFWPNNKSRMYLLENTGEFVKLHHLEEGDLLIVYRSQQGNFVLRGKKKKLLSEGGGAHSKVAHSLAKVFAEENNTPKVENFLTERLYGGALPEACGKVKEEPPMTGPDDDDPFFKEVMHRMGSSFGSGGLPNGSWEPLERFPSLNLDFVLDDMVVPKTDSDVADSSKGEDLVVGVVPKVEPAS